jgi:hypothetical protein
MSSRPVIPAAATVGRQAISTGILRGGSTERQPVQCCAKVAVNKNRGMEIPQPAIRLYYSI